MTFDEVLDQVRELLRQKGRLTYGAVKRRFDLDDAYLEDIKDELIEAERVAVDENGKVLVWVGKETKTEPENRRIGAKTTKPRLPVSEHRTPIGPTPDTQSPVGERRQLTVMFIDLVGSTLLSQQLDPEEYHARVVAYQTACRQIIACYEGHIAQYLGDGILAYFGYPAAHEDDAARAVRSGLECVTAVNQLPYTPPLQVRIGVHTGSAVVGEIGAGKRTEMLALGETPNLTARVQSVAEPNTVFLSPVTQRLVHGLFECQDLGLQTLKGISTPQSLYRVLGESAAQNRFEAAVQIGLTPLVGRESELGLLRQRWEQSTTGAGQVILLNGEPGIGKSRLVQELKEQVSAAGATRIEFRCSPYHQNSALSPIIDHLQRLLQFARDDTPVIKLEKLRHTLRRYRFLQADTLPLLAALLSLPHPEGYPLLTLSPQKQKEKTQAVLVAWLVEEAEKAPVLCMWEDLHWADPSTLEVLALLLDQAPTARLLVLLTFRPEFTQPWGLRSYLTQLTLSRLGQSQVEMMVKQVTGSTTLPSEVVQQIVAKTDGVPLFVEELTKNVIESVGAKDVSSLQFTIPATLQDSLMARLDRLNTAKETAQLGATIGREFSYELLYAVSPLDEDSLQQDLRQLVEVELLYQRGLPPRTTYLFKHALIQDTAYQSLLKSKRQQLHQQIAQVLEERFAETVEAQPELVAHHYTEAGLAEQAIPYWRQAGERASQRSAYAEAIAHFTRGLELLPISPDTPERVQQELALRLAQNDALIAVRGYTTTVVEKNVLRTRELCVSLGETPQLFSVLFRLWVFYIMRRELRTSYELAEQLMRLAQSVQDSLSLVFSHGALGVTSYWLGELSPARFHLEQAIALYNPQQHSRSSVGTADPRVDFLSYLAWTLWRLGYPNQSLKRCREAVTLATGLEHPFSLSYALMGSAILHLFLQEEQLAREETEMVTTLSTEQGFPFWLPQATIVHGWALTEQEQVEEGIAQIHQGLVGYQTMGAETEYLGFLPVLIATYAQAGQAEEGLDLLPEALDFVQRTEVRWYEAELYRLKGELTLQLEARDLGLETSPPSTQVSSEAEACFLKAIEISQKQQAKSLELRAATSLARLWQKQGKQTEARDLLASVYNWFTEGFDTKDLQEAKAQLKELS